MISLKSLLNERKLRVFDFDDTLVKTSSRIRVKKPDGNVITMSSHEYALYVADQGDEFDFSDFNYVVEPKPLVFATHILKAMQEKEGDRLITILTARATASASNIKKYLCDIGLCNVDVVALQSSDPFDKAKWIASQVERGYDDVTFIDDSRKNIDAVATLKRNVPGLRKIKLIYVGPKSVSSVGS